MTETIISKNITESFQEVISNLGFPCVGAKSALAKKQIVFCLADDIRNNSSDVYITEKLQEYAAKCTSDSLFVSFIVIFQNSPELSEIEFETYLWQRLQAIHDKDVLNFDWDSDVSSDPDSAQFSMSVGGKSFYVVGLHPNASRAARRFLKPVMVFNLHSQFQLLKENGNYTRIRETIRNRDEKINGDLNPMLADHGQSSETRQYSGRVLEDNWKCPFHTRQKE